MRRILAVVAALAVLALSYEPLATHAKGRSSGDRSSSGGHHSSAGSHSGTRSSSTLRASTRAHTSARSSTNTSSRPHPSARGTSPRAPSHPHTSNKTATPHATSSAGPHRSTYATGAQRDKRGRIERSAKAKVDFKRSNPCPSTGRSSGACPGYVIDHVQPLKRGGADSPSNMQWQTKQAAREKDKIE